VVLKYCYRHNFFCVWYWSAWFGANKIH